MDAQGVLTIINGATQLVALAPGIISALVELRDIINNSGTDYTAQVQLYRDGALQSAEETISLIEQWQAAHPVPAPAPAPGPALVPDPKAGQ